MELRSNRPRFLQTRKRLGSARIDGVVDDEAVRSEDRALLMTPNAPPTSVVPQTPVYGTLEGVESIQTVERSLGLRDDACGALIDWRRSRVQPVVRGYELAVPALPREAIIRVVVPDRSLGFASPNLFDLCVPLGRESLAFTSKLSAHLVELGEVGA